MKVVFVLDGGGIRGVIPARVLVAIEEALARPLHEAVDLVVGTSTGGIIALGIAAGLPAEEMLRLYVDRGPSIFRTNPLRRLRRFARLTAQTKYPAEPFERELRRVFADAPLISARVPVLVTAYDLRRGRPFMLRSWDEEAAHWRMWEAARATSAAPTYFAPYRGLWDGGVFANNPILRAWRAARSRWPHERLFVASFGTGSGELSIDPDDAKSVTQVATRIVDVMMDGQSDDAAGFLDGLEIPELAGYVRLQTTIRVASSSFDDASVENIHRLKAEAVALIGREAAALARVVASLEARNGQASAVPAQA